MATASLLTSFSSLARDQSKYSVNVNPLLKTRTQVHYQLVRKNKSFLIKRPEYHNNNFGVQCFMKPNNIGLDEKEKERTGKSLDEIIEAILKIMNLFIQKSAIAGVILGLLMTYNPHLALAASGGRMGGGHSFSSSSSSSPSYSSGGSSSSSRGNDSSSDDDSFSWSTSSYSSPSYYSATISSSSWPSYLPSSDDSSPNYSSTTSSVIEDEDEDEDEPETAPEAQKYSFSKDEPETAPGAQQSSPSEDESKTEARKSSVGEDKRKTAAFEVLKALGIVVIICGGIALISELRASDERRQPRQSSAFDEPRQPTMSRQSTERRQPKQSRQQSSVDTNKVTVMMLQVGLLGATRSLQKDLDKIAKVADTSTTSGLSYILKESTLALLRHFAYCFSSYSSVDVKPDKTDGENLFNQLTIEERSKFDEETLVNVDNIKKQSTPRKNPNGLSSDYIVMTILVAAKGENKLCVVNSSENLKEALQKLGSIPSCNILEFEGNEGDDGSMEGNAEVVIMAEIEQVVYQEPRKVKKNQTEKQLIWGVKVDGSSGACTVTNIESTTKETDGKKSSRADSNVVKSAEGINQWVVSGVAGPKSERERAKSGALMGVKDLTSGKLLLDTAVMSPEELKEFSYLKGKEVKEKFKLDREFRKKWIEREKRSTGEMCLASGSFLDSSVTSSRPSVLNGRDLEVQGKEGEDGSRVGQSEIASKTGDDQGVDQEAREENRNKSEQGLNCGVRVFEPSSTDKVNFSENPTKEGEGKVSSTVLSSMGEISDAFNHLVGKKSSFSGPLLKKKVDDSKAKKQRKTEMDTCGSGTDANSVLTSEELSELGKLTTPYIRNKFLLNSGYRREWMERNEILDTASSFEGPGNLDSEDSDDDDFIENSSYGNCGSELLAHALAKGGRKSRMRARISKSGRRHWG